jgi:phosphoadenosine phosphosulfate reductase
MNAIALYARQTPGFTQRVDEAYETLRLAALEHPDRIVQATSLGAEDMVITDLIARHGLRIAIATLETGKLHPQTVNLIDRIKRQYAIEIEVYHPQEHAVLAFVEKNGEQAMFNSIDLRKACCALRKLEPLSRMLSSRGAWITGLRREQSSQRGAVSSQELDEQGRVKFNPLADWSWADVWHYIATYNVPYNPLHDEFMPSIGCAPCTRAIAVGEDFRAGRWWWEDEKAKECGLHVPGEQAAVSVIGDRT